MDDIEVLECARVAMEKEDYLTAIRLFEPLLDRDNSVALNSMGLLMQHGLGQPRDIAKAISLFEKAVGLGNGFAAHNLGTLYSIEGISGCPEPQLSRQWYLKAYDLGAIVASEDWYTSLRAQQEA